MRDTVTNIEQLRELEKNSKDEGRKNTIEIPSIEIISNDNHKSRRENYTLSECLLLSSLLRCTINTRPQV
jgi:hypothetical protein